MKRIVSAVLIMTVLSGILSGCFFPATEELYSLPQLSETYLSLQQEIDEVMADGAEYSAPVSGNNRESVQRADIDGDGQLEAVACFASSASEKPLRICIFDQNESFDYELKAQITGDGTAIDRVYYEDINGDGWCEVIIGWKMSADLRIASVYSIKSYSVNEQFNYQYSDTLLCDMNGDGLNDVCAVCHSSDMTGTATVYCRSEGEYEQMTVQLSSGIQGLVRVKNGYISDMLPALFVTSSYEEGGYVTDILAFKDDELLNVSIGKSGTVSSERVAYSSVYETDINGDGMTEFPKVFQLPSSSENANYWLLNWRSCSVNGKMKHVMTTFHCYSDGWYYRVPETWSDKISVRRSSAISGVNTVIFSVWDSETETATDFLRIYKLTGDNKEDRAAITGRFILKYKADTIYAAQILLTDSDWKYAPTEDEVKEAFNLIYGEWVTGEVG